jgi:hypothetical protein
MAGRARVCACARFVSRPDLTHSRPVARVPRALVVKQNLQALLREVAELVAGWNGNTHG